MRRVEIYEKNNKSQNTLSTHFAARKDYEKPNSQFSVGFYSYAKQAYKIDFEILKVISLMI